MSKHRSWCITINNYTEENVKQLKELKYKYLVFGYEVGESGTKHIQGYVTLNSPSTIVALNKKLDNKAHLTVAKGNASQNRQYCTKDGKFEEYGELPKQGKRNDIHEVREILETGGNMRQVVTQCNSYQSGKFGELYLKYVEEKRNWKPIVYWLWGQSGTGKTKMAFELSGKEPYVNLTNMKWWDGYDKHENVIIDELRPSTMAADYLLRLLDRYPLAVEIKGSTRQFLAKQIIITSCMSPQQWWSEAAHNENIQQLIRRIDTIKEFGGEYLQINGNDHGTEQRSGVIVRPLPDKGDTFDDIFK